MWAHGIDEGEAFDCRRTEPGFQVMLDRGRWRSGTGARSCQGAEEGTVGVGGAGFLDVVGLEISAARDACAARLDGEYSEWERGRGRGEDFSSTTFWKGDSPRRTTIRLSPTE